MANNIGDLGFNGSGSRFNSRFGSGEPILAKQLNDLASGIQSGLSMPYLGEGPSISFTSGGTIITNLDTAIGGGSGGELKQFDCFIEKWQDPENPEADPEYRLRCVRGLTSFENYNVDEKGFITDEVFVYNHRLNKWNVWMTNSFEYDPNDDSKIYLDDGYIKLEKNKNYKVFIYKVNPTIDAWPESQSAQIAIIEEGSPADENVIQKYNGGGSMQVYLVSKTESIENIVTADSFSGKIADFNPAEMLNDYINFDPSYLSVTRALNPSGPDERHPNLYPSGMSDWLSYNVPAFAKPSTSQFAQTIDGMIIGGVPNDFAGDGIIGKLLGYPTNGVEYGYSGYAGNYLQNDVVKAWNVNERYGWDSNPYVSGLINPSDFEIIIYNDLSDNVVVNFDDADLDIIASSQTAVSSTTLEMATGGAVGNVGFKYFDCARKEIAYIKWIATDPDKPEVKEHFDIYQINNGPINFNYKPMLLDVKKVETNADAHWETDNDSWVSPDIVEISSWGDYEDDLISNKYKENDAKIGGFLPNHPTRSSG